jgi:putative FmdB family regulatory protein
MDKEENLMPCYDYKCMECGHISEHTHIVNIKLRNIRCPHCNQWARVKRLIYTPTIKEKRPMHKIVNKNNALKLNEYNDTQELVSGNVSEDGKFWMDWAIASEYNSSEGHSVPVKKDDGKYRNVPIKIILGDSKEQAIENVKWLLGELEDHDTAASSVSDVMPPGDTPPLDDDVPF